VFTGAFLVSAATGVSGLLTYAFLVLAARQLGPTAYGQVGVLWGAMFISAIVLFRPLEQTTSRAVADRLAKDGDVLSVLRSVAALAALLAVAAIVAVVGAWRPVVRSLFAGSDTMGAMLVAGSACYGLAYLTRGLVGGIRWFGGYALALLGDAVTRLVVAVPLLVVASQTTAAAALVAAGLAGAVVPLVVGRRRLAGLGRSRGGTPFRIRSALAFASPAAVVAAADQLLVNGAPILVIVDGGTDARRVAGVVFAATMLVRAPVYVFQGLAASLLSNLTHLNATGARRAFREAVTRAVRRSVAAGAVFTGAVAVVGPLAMQAVYGDAFAAGRLSLVLLAAGVGCYLGATTLSQALLSTGQTALTATAWAVAATGFVGVFACMSGDALKAASAAFAAGCAAAFLLLAGLFAFRTG
jgi:O-antigen/teichoic acid export membrane protein